VTRGAARLVVRLVVGLVVLLVLSACSGGGGDDAADTAATTVRGDRTTMSIAASGVSANDLCEGAVAARDGSTVQDPELIETSGIATSSVNDGVIWAHNDSGGAPAASAIGPGGDDLGSFTLEGAEASDWEDMALVDLSIPDHPRHSLYLADIGDNLSARDSVTIYEAEEPRPRADASDGEIPVTRTISATYVDGPRDAETLLADPATGDLFIISKEWLGAPAGLYRISGAAVDGDTVEMERVAEPPLPAGELATGGAISSDGSLIAIRTYGQVLLWDRRPDQTVAEALTGEPCQAPGPAESQGEAIAFTSDGRGYVTISEGANPAINRFTLS